MVDAHVHFWDPTKHYYPWLNDEPMIPFRYGDYSAIRRPYYPAEHLADARRHGHNIVRTVYLEAEWDPKDPIGEMEFIAELRQGNRLARCRGGPGLARPRRCGERAGAPCRNSPSCAACARSPAPMPRPATGGRAA